MIAKSAENSSSYSRRIIPFKSARTAFGAILNALKIAPGKVLLPSYIGWSPREGSGVFDPIESLSLDYCFYALDEHLHIDLESLRAELQRGYIRVLVIIHFFGYVDPSYEESIKIAREFGVFILEDEAHAMLTDLVGGICGRLGDACVYSFHKLLPVTEGGAAVINDPTSIQLQTLAAGTNCISPLCDFDLNRIAIKRRSNTLLLDKLIEELMPEIEPLFGAPGYLEFPQTYPVLIRSGSRDSLYHEMNAAGFGVVSLYHTLILQIPPGSFPRTANVSRYILNLPVHQDVSEDALESMVRELTRSVRTLKVGI